MELEQQVCSMESAKRLKELGVKQESLIHWRFFPGYGDQKEKWELRHYSDFRRSTAAKGSKPLATPSSRRSRSKSS